MKQAEFSELTKKYLGEHHPEFLENIKEQKDGSFECNVRSNKGKLTLWVATFDAEITIGFEDDNELSDWNITMSDLGARNAQQELQMMSRMLNQILTGAVAIEYTDDTGYELGEYSEEEPYEEGEDDFIKSYKWGDL